LVIAYQYINNILYHPLFSPSKIARWTSNAPWRDPEYPTLLLAMRWSCWLLCSSIPERN